MEVYNCPQHFSSVQIGRNLANCDNMRIRPILDRRALGLDRIPATNAPLAKKCQVSAVGWFDLLVETLSLL